MNSSIIEFYSGHRSDHRGRYLNEIQAWTVDRLEATHDYIQWLFPLDEPSAFNADAPVLDKATIRQFRSSPDLQQSLRTSSSACS